MAGNKTITQLPAASTLDGTELLPVVQAGQTVQTTAQDIANLGGGLQTSLVSPDGNTQVNVVDGQATVSSHSGSDYSSIVETPTSITINVNDGVTTNETIITKNSLTTTKRVLSDDGFTVSIAPFDAAKVDTNGIIVMDSSLSTNLIEVDRVTDIAKYNGVEIATLSDIPSLTGYEQTSNKSSSYTASSTTTYANTKALVDGLATKESTSNKDASGGYVGLTLFKINFKNVLNTFTSFFTNSNTAARTYTFQDRNGTIADDTDLALKSPIASPTFTGTVTTPAIIVSSETASRVAIIDGSKNVKSADTATYPSLTELAYVKGVTSAIQTQLDALNKMTVLILTGGNQSASVNTNTDITSFSFSPTINKRYEIDGKIRFQCSGNGGSKFQITLPTGATMDVILNGFSSTGTAYTFAILNTSASLSSSVFGNVTGGTLNGWVTFKGEVQMSSTSGSITFGYASGTNGQTTTINQLGTIIKFRQLD